MSLQLVVCLSVYKYHRDSHWTDFRETGYFGTCMKICREKQNLVKVVKNIDDSLIIVEITNCYLTEVNESIAVRNII